MNEFHFCIKIGFLENINLMKDILLMLPKSRYQIHKQH